MFQNEVASVSYQYFKVIGSRYFGILVTLIPPVCNFQHLKGMFIPDKASGIFIRLVAEMTFYLYRDQFYHFIADNKEVTVKSESLESGIQGSS